MSETWWHQGALVTAPSANGVVVAQPRIQTTVEAVPDWDLLKLDEALKEAASAGSPAVPVEEAFAAGLPARRKR
jgi:ribosomal protein L12E/L44/L45/RPP1/RPP2